jgi:peptidoglycan hydrolase-like protein with peptidoglycan-binding domain
LIWKGHYTGIIDGKEGGGTRQAIKSFQSDIGHKTTGNLSREELALLAKQGNERKQATGFANVEDGTAGVSVGIPKKLVTNSHRTKWGDQLELHRSANNHRYSTIH